MKKNQIIDPISKGVSVWIAVSLLFFACEVEERNKEEVVQEAVISKTEEADLPTEVPATEQPVDESTSDGFENSIFTKLDDSTNEAKAQFASSEVRTQEETSTARPTLYAREEDLSFEPSIEEEEVEEDDWASTEEDDASRNEARAAADRTSAEVATTSQAEPTGNEPQEENAPAPISSESDTEVATRDEKEIEAAELPEDDSPQPEEETPEVEAVKEDELEEEVELIADAPEGPEGDEDSSGGAQEMPSADLMAAEANENTEVASTESLTQETESNETAQAVAATDAPATEIAEESIPAELESEDNDASGETETADHQVSSEQVSSEELAADANESATVDQEPLAQQVSEETQPVVEVATASSTEEVEENGEIEVAAVEAVPVASSTEVEDQTNAPENVEQTQNDQEIAQAEGAVETTEQIEAANSEASPQEQENTPLVAAEETTTIVANQEAADSDADGDIDPEVAANEAATQVENTVDQEELVTAQEGQDTVTEEVQSVVDREETPIQQSTGEVTEVAELTETEATPETAVQPEEVQNISPTREIGVAEDATQATDQNEITTTEEANVPTAEVATERSESTGELVVPESTETSETNQTATALEESNLVEASVPTGSESSEVTQATEEPTVSTASQDENGVVSESVQEMDPEAISVTENEDSAVSETVSNETSVLQAEVEEAAAKEQVIVSYDNTEEVVDNDVASNELAPATNAISEETSPIAEGTSSAEQVTENQVAETTNQEQATSNNTEIEESPVNKVVADQAQEEDPAATPVDQTNEAVSKDDQEEYLASQDSARQYLIAKIPGEEEEEFNPLAQQNESDNNAQEASQVSQQATEEQVSEEQASDALAEGSENVVSEATEERTIESEAQVEKSQQVAGNASQSNTEQGAPSADVDNQTVDNKQPVDEVQQTKVANETNEVAKDEGATAEQLPSGNNVYTSKNTGNAADQPASATDETVAGSSTSEVVTAASDQQAVANTNNAADSQTGTEAQLNQNEQQPNVTNERNEAVASLDEEKGNAQLPAGYKVYTSKNTGQNQTDPSSTAAVEENQIAQASTEEPVIDVQTEEGVASRYEPTVISITEEEAVPSSEVFDPNAAPTDQSALASQDVVSADNLSNAATDENEAAPSSSTTVQDQADAAVVENAGATNDPNQVAQNTQQKAPTANTQEVQNNPTTGFDWVASYTPADESVKEAPTSTAQNDGSVAIQNDEKAPQSNNLTAQQQPSAASGQIAENATTDEQQQQVDVDVLQQSEPVSDQQVAASSRKEESTPAFNQPVTQQPANNTATNPDEATGTTRGFVNSSSYNAAAESDFNRTDQPPKSGWVASYTPNASDSESKGATSGFTNSEAYGGTAPQEPVERSEDFKQYAPNSIVPNNPITFKNKKPKTNPELDETQRDAPVDPNDPFTDQNNRIYSQAEFEATVTEKFAPGPLSFSVEEINEINYDTTETTVVTQKIIKTEGSSFSRYISPTRDGGVIITGEVEIGDRMDIFLMKLDANHQIEWSKNLGAKGKPVGKCVVQAENGDYLMTGTSDNDIILVRADPQGNIKWAQAYGGPYEDVAKNLRIEENGNIVIKGYMTNVNGWDVDAYMIETNQNGQKLRSVIKGGIDMMILNDFQRQTEHKHPRYRITSDNVYFFNGIPTNVYGIQLDPHSQGDRINLVGETSRDLGNAIIPEGDNFFVVAGNGQDDKMVLYYVNTFGKTIWKKELGAGYVNTGRSVAKVGANEFVLVGNAEEGRQRSDIYLTQIKHKGSQNETDARQ